MGGEIVQDRLGDSWGGIAGAESAFREGVKDLPYVGEADFTGL